MSINDLYSLLGRAYAAKIMRHGAMADVRAEFISACDDPDFVSAARTKMSALEEVAAKMSAHGVQHADRDVIGAAQLEFLRDALSAV